MNEVSAVGTQVGGLCTALVAAGVHLQADEPDPETHAACGPNPYDYLLTALGACTAMTLRLYAQRKEWPLQEVEVHLSYSREYRKDCLACEEKGNLLDVIERRVVLQGPLSQEQLQRLAQIAERCPVHKTLTAGVDIRSTYPQLPSITGES